MKTMSRTAGWLAWMALAGVALAGADEDLAVVKKAVADARNSQTPASPPAEAAPAAAPAPGRGGGKPEPQWLRVRVLERDAKGETRKRVSVNLPLSLVRAFDDFPIDLCGHHRRTDEPRPDRRRCDLRVADVLAALEGGQELVEVEAEESTVKVWVD
jgi:hypothetical protein